MRPASVIVRYLTLCLLAMFAGHACAETDSSPRDIPPFLHLLQANVGNVEVQTCGEYQVSLCRVDVEENLTQNIQALGPDIVMLQEVVSDQQCEDITETDPGKVCHPDARAEIPTQARRLVGSGYSIACDSRNGYECIAVATGFGTIKGCEPGTLCADGAITPGIPEECDGGFSVSAVDVVPADGPGFRLVNAHPSSTSPDCRNTQLRQVFEGWNGDPALVAEGPTLLAGDFNLDPFTDIPMGGPDDPSIETWQQHVGDGKRFAYHSGPAEHEPPYPTILFLVDYVLDHVASDFLTGSCLTLGEAPGTSRLDGFDDEAAWYGTDHRALDCRLHLPQD